MPIYDYACPGCGHRFERLQPMNAPREAECPRCSATAERVMVAGAGLVFGSGTARKRETSGGCSFEETGTTCCGRRERCGAPPCE